MDRFAWSAPRSVAEAATLASDAPSPTAMLADPARRRADCVVLKAGGIDLLDLMKEGLLRAAPRGESARDPGPRYDRRGRRRRHAHRRPGDAGAARGASRCRPALYGAGRCRGAFGQPADPPRGDARRQPAATAALLVFPLCGASLPAQGRRPLLRLCTARTSTTPCSAKRSARSCTLPPRRPRWWRSMRASSWSTPRARRAAAAAGRILGRPRDRRQRETDLRAGRSPDRRAAAAAAGGHARRCS